MPRERFAVLKQQEVLLVPNILDVVLHPKSFHSAGPILGKNTGLSRCFFPSLAHFLVPKDGKQKKSMRIIFDSTTIRYTVQS